MTVVVTGARGLLGRHVTAALRDAGTDVREVDVLAAGDGVRADLTRSEEADAAVAGARAVVHAAGIPRPGGHPSERVLTVNALSCFNVAAACERHGVPRLVNASSVSVLGIPFNVRPIRPAYLPVDEGHPLAAQEAYALSKRFAEDILDAAVARTAVTAVSVRLPWIQTPESFQGDIAARRGDAAITDRNLWAYIDARDAARAMCLAVDCEIDGHVRAFATAADTFMPECTRALVRRAFGDIELRRPLEGHASVVDGTRARALLGFAPRHSWRDYPCSA